MRRKIARAGEEVRLRLKIQRMAKATRNTASFQVKAKGIEENRCRKERGVALEHRTTSE